MNPPSNLAPNLPPQPGNVPNNEQVPQPAPPASAVTTEIVQNIPVKKPDSISSVNRTADQPPPQPTASLVEPQSGVKDKELDAILQNLDDTGTALKDNSQDVSSQPKSSSQELTPKKAKKGGRHGNPPPIAAIVGALVVAALLCASAFLVYSKG